MERTQSAKVASPSNLVLAMDGSWLKENPLSALLDDVLRKYDESTTP